MRLAVLLLATLASGAAMADQYHTWGFGPSYGQPILGSDESRRGWLIDYSYIQPARAFSIRSNPGNFLAEAYYLNTVGGGYNNHPVNVAHSYGTLFGARWNSHFVKGSQTYVDFGIGLEYNSIKTVDLDSNLNTTPFLDLGFKFKIGGQDVTLMARYLHISNGGTHRPNRGSNNLQYVLSIWF